MRSYSESVRKLAAFAGGRAPVQDALAQFSRQCERHDIPHAVLGGLAVWAHGDRSRVTEDVDVIMSKGALEKFKDKSIGKGWSERFPGSKNLRDTVNKVNIDIVLAGAIPGSGKPEDTPIRFPDPEEEEDLIRHGVSPHVSLRRLIELKMASGTTDRTRRKDLVDVEMLVRIKDLDEEFASHLHPSVREEFKNIVEIVREQLIREREDTEGKS